MLVCNLMREGKEVDLIERRGGEELGGVEGGAGRRNRGKGHHNQDMVCGKKNLFSIKINQKATDLHGLQTTAHDQCCG